MLDRRSLIRNGFAAGAGLSFTPAWRCLSAQSVLRLSRTAAAPARIPKDFLGFGYEMSAVATAGLLSVGNARYVQLIRNLSPYGVLRVGGIVADYTRYSRGGAAVSEPKNTVLNHDNLKQFAAFLNSVGWTTIWSLNFAQGSLADAIVEAREVAAVLGSRLLAFEIGNEVENYSRGDKPFRTPPYAYETYRAEYTQWHEAISKAVPSARFAAPDTAASIDWVERMSKDAHGDVQLLTTHYYRGSQRDGTAEQLLRPDPGLRSNLARLRSASERSGIPWRMCETNSFFGGGRPGVSDTFVGALWTLDFLLVLASSGCAGVNLETGVNQLGFISSYSPIQDDGTGNNRAGAPYYGMLAFAAATRGCRYVSALGGTLETEDLTAYALSAATDGGGVGNVLALVLVNRGATPFKVSLAGFHRRQERARILRLEAPDAASKTEVSFGGAAVSADGHWEPSRMDVLDGQQIHVAGLSAAIVRIGSNSPGAA